MTRIANIAIIGGGIGGMCAAIELQKQGKKVRIFELNSTLRPIGAGITLSAATLRALKKIGIVDQLFQVASGFSQFDTYTAEGVKIAETPVKAAVGAEDLPATNLGIMRTTFAQILEQHLRQLGVSVSLSSTVTQIENLADGVKITLSDGSIEQFDLLIGADGIHSKVRNLVFKPTVGTNFTHQGSWRIVVPRYFDYFTMMIGKTLKASFCPMNATESYMCVLDHREKDVRIETDELAGKLSALLQQFGSVAQDIRQRLDQGLIRPEDIVYRPLHTFMLEDAWHQGRVVLLGDAIHATTPHLASGAGLAIEGALILSEELAKQQPVEEALQHYRRRHFQRAKYVIDVSTRLGELEMQNGSIQEHRTLMKTATDQLTLPLLS